MMKKIFFVFTAIFSSEMFAQSPDVTLRFDAPATHFTESLPVGNGRLGAMLFGNPQKERIVLNEISMWSGGKFEADTPNSHQYLKPIQELLIQGKNQEAQRLLSKHFVTTPENGSCFGNGKDCHYGCFQMLGTLVLNWHKDTPRTNYKRLLNLENTIASVTYKQNGVHITERLFADFKNDILWLEIQAKKPVLDLTFALERAENASFSAEGNQLIMRGQLTNAKEKGLSFVSIAEVQTNGKQQVKDASIIVTQASKILVKISGNTNYNFKNGDLTTENLLQKSKKQLEIVQKTAFETAHKESVAIYSTFFNRNRWKSPIMNKKIQDMTTFQRLHRYYEGEKDGQLPILYYNFGRYLLISSSREGLLPANLQGLWADSYQTPWNGDYHLNINVQMNYWLAEMTNLPSLAEPLFRLTKNLVPNGEKTAKAYYNAEGWVAHILANPWFFTSPGEGAEWGSTLTGGAWLCAHIWEHYRFNNDENFLRTYYPVLKGAAIFLQNILIKDPKTGYLVTAPSNSPENAYLFPLENGKTIALTTCLGPTMDMQIARELFGNVSQVAKILQVDAEKQQEWTKILSQLAPNVIGKNGDLNEWQEDWDDAHKEHRHISHLYGLHPYDEITPWDTPELAKASEKTLQMRGDGGTGWSRAWKINFWARLGNGNHALKLFHELLKPASHYTEKGTLSGGGTYANLFCAHPPFQIDGNFGGVAGLAEMLLQSHGKEEVIRLLPALPIDADFQAGNVIGMRARGGFTLDFQWKEGVIKEAKITSTNGKKCKILLPKGKAIYKNGKRITDIASAETIVRFDTQKGEIFLMK